MERWDRVNKEYRDNVYVDAFIEAIKQVCEKHKFVIMHEDTEGAFVIMDYNEKGFDWLNHAHFDLRRVK